MKSKKNLVLIGMMASGKSTFGRILSIKLNYEFYDVDKIIEKETNMKISEIFDKKGESYFRTLEEEITLKFLNTKNSVISLGGGGFLNNAIRKKTILTSKTFWLNNGLSTLINRINKNNKRPIAKALNNKELKNLIIERSKVYDKADFKIDCENQSKSNITRKILSLYESK